MQTTTNYGLKKPDGTDVVDIQDFNDNADVIDLALKQAMDAAVTIGSHAATHRPGSSDPIPTAAPSGGLGTANTAGSSTSLARADHTHLAFDSTNPVANGTVSAGSAATAARRDHVHPTDTTRAPLASPSFTGTPTAPTAVPGTNSTQIATTAFVVSQFSELAFQTASGSATAITLTGVTLSNGYSKTFIANANNNGSATTINGKPLYKPGTTTAPMLVSGKAYTVWYSLSGDCFFIKASAEGTAVAENVLAGKTFSNDNDTGLTGTMPNNGGTVTITPGTSNIVKPAGYYSGAITVSGDPDLIAANIMTGKNIFNVAGIAIPLPSNAQGYGILSEIAWHDTSGTTLHGASLNGDKTGIVFTNYRSNTSPADSCYTLNLSTGSVYAPCNSGDDYLRIVGTFSDNGFVPATWDGSSGQEYIGMIHPSLTGIGSTQATFTVDGYEDSRGYGGNGIIAISNSNNGINFVATHIWRDIYSYPNHNVTNRIKVTYYTNGVSPVVKTDNIVSFLGDTSQALSNAIAVSKFGVSFFFYGNYCYKIENGATTWTTSSNIGAVDASDMGIKTNLYPFVDDGPGGDGYLYVLTGAILKKIDPSTLSVVWSRSTVGYGTARISYFPTASSIIILMDTCTIVVIDKITGNVKSSHKIIGGLNTTDALVITPRFALPGNVENEIYFGYNARMYGQSRSSSVIAKGVLI